MITTRPPAWTPASIRNASGVSDGAQFGLYHGAGARADDAFVRMREAPRVIGYVRFLSGAMSGPSRESVLRATASERGYHLVDVVHSTDVSTLARGCSGISRILDLVASGQVDGVLTLASYTIAWDYEVVRRIAARIQEHAAFLDFVWPRPARRPHPAHLDRTPR